MNMRMKNIRPFLLFLLVFCLVSFNRAAELDSKWERTFNVHQGGTLKLESDLGSIDVTTGSNDKVEVRITHKIDSWDDDEEERILDDLNISYDQKKDNVFIRVEFDWDGFFNWKKNKLRLHFDITVPGKYNLDLKTAGGSITVDDLEGEVRTRTSGGSMKFGHINGPVWGNTSGGSIHLNSSVSIADLSSSGGSIKIGNVDGEVKASTSGGSITIEKAKATISASTSGGGITVNEVNGTINGTTSGGSITAYITSQPESDCKLTTSGGSINVYLDSDIKAHLNAATSGGKVNTDFPVTIKGELKKHKLKANINGGGPELYLRTSGGNIHIHEI